jgi:hypothetical protein
MDPKAIQLFQEVLAKTKAGKIRWEPLAVDNEFFAVLPGAFTVNVSSQPMDSWGASEYELVLRDQGHELIRVWQNNSTGEPGVSELYELARRQALRVDANVDKLLGELAKL